MLTLPKYTANIDVYKRQVLNIFSYDEGLVDVGELNGVFHVQKPTKLLLTLNIEGTEARNSYDCLLYTSRCV